MADTLFPARVTNTTNALFAAPTVSNVDLKSAAVTNLYTVPAGKTFYLTDVIVEVTASDTFAVAASGSVGVTSAYNEWCAITALTGLSAVGAYLSLSTASALPLRRAFTAGEVVGFKVTTGATATTLTAKITPVGFLV